MVCFLEGVVAWETRRKVICVLPFSADLLLDSVRNMQFSTYGISCSYSLICHFCMHQRVHQRARTKRHYGT